MKTFVVTYNVTLTIEVQADSADEAERLADRELPLHCDVNRAVSCHRITASAARTYDDNRTTASKIHFSNRMAGPTIASVAGRSPHASLSMKSYSNKAAGSSPK